MKALIPLLAVLLAGCATAHKLPTRSGLPEIESSARLEQLAASIRQGVQAIGGELTQESAHLLVFHVPASAGAKFWFTNTLTGQQPVLRLRFNLVEAGDLRRVTVTQYLVHQPGLGGTSESMLHAKHQVEPLQRFLEKVKAEAEK